MENEITVEQAREAFDRLRLGDYGTDDACEEIRKRQADEEVVDAFLDQHRWRGIESAPRDGARVLLFREGFAESTCVGWWSVADAAWVPVCGAMTLWDAGIVTHWQPLPGGPE